MFQKNKVIPFDRSRSKGRQQGQSASTDSAPVFDMTERRAEIIQEERRTVRRTILTEFIGAFCVVPERGLMKVALYDISENGLAFDVDPQAGSFLVGEEIAMRVYMNHKTYFPFQIQITNQRTLPEDGVNRFGASFVKGTINDEALFHFVKFIESVSANLEQDNGDVMVSNLRK